MFFGSDFVERIIHSAQPLGFVAVEDRTRGYLARRSVNYCIPQGLKSAFLEGNDCSTVKIPPGRLSDNYRICCFVELILLQEIPARKAKHPLSRQGRGLLRDLSTNSGRVAQSIRFPPLALIFHEWTSRDRGDECATGQPQGVGAEAYLHSTSQGPTPENARKDTHIRGRSRPFMKYAG